MSQTILTADQINGMTKVQLQEAITGLQNSLPLAINEIPAIAAKEAIVENGVTTFPAIEAKAGISIQDQINALPDVVTYNAACEAIDKQNEALKLGFETSPEYLAAKVAVETVTKFNTDNKVVLDQIAALNTDLLNLDKKASEKGANLRQIRTDKMALMTKIDALDLSIVYPENYETLICTELPTFTPTAYPVFTSNVVVTLPLTFVYSGKKVGRKVAATSTEKASTSGSLTEECKAEIQALRIANLAAGNSAGKGLSAIEKKYGVSHGTAGGYIASLKA